MRKLKNFINGDFVESNSSELSPVFNPATAELLAQVPMGTSQDVDRAVSTAAQSFLTWRLVPAVERARLLFRFKTLIDQHSEELAQIVSQEHGKTLSEARGSIKRGIENCEHACGIASLMLGESSEDVATGIDTISFRQPMGVFSAICPYNFPAMVPMWFWPYALMSGNTFVLKPSEKVPLSAELQIKLIKEAGFPSGVINLVNGGQAVAKALIEHEAVQGISFVGSTPVAKIIYEKAARAGKRVQALGGAKNHVVIMPDCQPEQTVSAVIESAFGCTGQRCLAASIVILVGDAYDKILPLLINKAKALRLGSGLDTNTDMGPLISAEHLERVKNFIEQGCRDGAELLLDGREASLGLNSQSKSELSKGHFIGPSILAQVRPTMSIMREEIFGPVLCLTRADNLEQATNMIKACSLANATSIFTQSGASARFFKHEVGVSMIGINIGVAAPMAFFPFGGTKNSFFGDTKAHGPDAVRFYTDTKVVTQGWF